MEPSPDDYLQRILNARVYDLARETPLEVAPGLSARIGSTLYLKREDLQPVFSFKVRGAYNRMAHLSSNELAQGVVCSSAGNHAQGVALAAKKLRCAATIVMPVTTPRIKIEAVEARGAKVVLAGESYSDAQVTALTMAREQGLVFVHPYDDPDVIAGQGTVAMEILRQHNRHIDAVFVPVGGGGLIGGIASYIKALRPETRIIGVEPEDSPAMTLSLAAGKPIELPTVGLFADGVAVRQVGAETFRVAARHVDEMLLVDNDAICAAIKDVFEDTRSLVEPAGALAVAGAKAWCDATPSRSGLTMVAITSGANTNFDRLLYVAERAEVGEHREALLAVTIPERPGSFRTFCDLIGHRAITEFNYRYDNPERAHIFVGVQVRDASERRGMVSALQEASLGTLDLSDDELAKLHVRHMVGGRAPMVDDELLFRFDFPERPGALGMFLNSLMLDWNISLFHYRNHGADVGRVLVGLQVPPSERGQIGPTLDAIGYPWVEETTNPTYRLFLQ